MFTPKKLKHRKWHNKPIGRKSKKDTKRKVERGHVKEAKVVKATRKKDIAFGEFALKSLEASRVTGRQLEAARRAMTRYVQRGGKIWIRVFTQRPVTLKGGEIRMGGGKGGVDHFVAHVKAGTILFEMAGVTEQQAREAMQLAAHKLPVKTKFITKDQ